VEGLEEKAALAGKTVEEWEKQLIVEEVSQTLNKFSSNEGRGGL